MVSFKKLAIPVFAGMLLLGGLAACDREGPMERAGKKSTGRLSEPVTRWKGRRISRTAGRDHLCGANRGAQMGKPATHRCN